MSTTKGSEATGRTIRVGLIGSGKTGRVRICHLKPDRLSSAESWLAEQRTLWERRADRLADYVENKILEDGHDNRKS